MNWILNIYVYALQDMMSIAHFPYKPTTVTTKGWELKQMDVCTILSCMVISRHGAWVAQITLWVKTNPMMLVCQGTTEIKDYGFC